MGDRRSRSRDSTPQRDVECRIADFSNITFEYRVKRRWQKYDAWDTHLLRTVFLEERDDEVTVSISRGREVLLRLRRGQRSFQVGPAPRYHKRRVRVLF